MSHPVKIAEHLNKFFADRPFDFKAIAESKAQELGVGLYWSGTATIDCGNTSAEVWKMNEKKEWTKKIGEVVLGHDNIWRA